LQFILIPLVVIKGAEVKLLGGYRKRGGPEQRRSNKKEAKEERRW